MHPIIKALATQLSHVPEVERVVLFGSRARGDAAPRSDIDLAVECPNASRVVWNTIREQVLDARTLLFIDLVRLDRAPEALRHHVLTDGVVLYEAVEIPHPANDGARNSIDS